MSSVGRQDYEAEEVLVVHAPEQLRALGDDRRGRIVALLRERAASTTELARAMQMPKGTVGYHVKVLEQAGLIRVVRTRRVRAVTEKYYGRVARLFVLKGSDEVPELHAGSLPAVMLRQAADELLAAAPTTETSAFVHVRLTPAHARRMTRRADRLVADFLAADDPAGELHGLAMAVFPTNAALPPGNDE